MSDPFNIYGSVVQFRCPFGLLFVHVNVAPRHKHRDRVYAIEAAVRDLSLLPKDGEEQVLPFGYVLEVKGVKCDRMRVRFGHLCKLPERVIDTCFQYQKGGIREDDAFLVEVSFLAKAT